VKRAYLRVVVLALLIGLVGSASAWANVHASRRSRIHRSGGHRERPTSVLLESLELPRPGQLESLQPDFAINAAAAILMDGRSGQVLFARNPDEALPPASVTKILTALVILENGNLGDTVTVSRAAASVGGFRLGLHAGQRTTLEDLLAAVLIRSANDAAVAAAEHVGGGLARFVDLMNARAQQIGMIHSHFANPHGLDEPTHYTTARDMALLTRVALDHPLFARLVSAREARVKIWRTTRRGLSPQPRLILSHNKLLGRLEGADGVKTGYTGSAGRCLVGSASRGERRMITVLLNDPRRWSDAALLLEYGFLVAGSSAQTEPAGSPSVRSAEVRSRLAAEAREEHP